MVKHEELSKFLALILRHKPETVGIQIDEHGWADVNDLIRKINAESTYEISHEILDEIVDTDDKQRYSYNSDKTKIRANQGHSIPVDVELKECIPPQILYHGTSAVAYRAIQKEGIKPMSRLYVHLSPDTQTAFKVGSRHGDPRIIYVDTVGMRRDGYKFYQSANGVWLTYEVPPKYFIMVSDGQLEILRNGNQYNISNVPDGTTIFL